MTAKSFIQARLEKLVVTYMRRHKPKLVVVVGSVGKTTTKIAIATVLGEKYRVRTHDGNHNSPLSVPLAILGVQYPADVHSPLAWLAVYRAARARISQATDTDVIVQELGVDHPGDMAAFMRYLRPDGAVVTAVSDEHMEYFKTLDAVASEELSIAKASGWTIVNRDDVDAKYAAYAPTTQIGTYGLGEGAEYQLVLSSSATAEGRAATLVTPAWGSLPLTLQLIGDHTAKSLAAAAAVADRLGLSSTEVAVGIGKARSIAGRMKVLRGLNGSILLDDTYNSSPLAATAALRTLQSIQCQQRIAILGSMNELGDISPAAHRAIGAVCDPSWLDWVVTIGKDAEQYLAPAAAQNGCRVKSFASPYEAGGFVHSVLAPGGVVLAKGSQNGVFAEEALKVLLHTPEDEVLLVRQSADWLAIKRQQFEQPTGAE